MLTEAGKQAMEMAYDYKLGDFYDPHTGNIIIADGLITPEVLVNVYQFLGNNEDCVCGHEEGYLYITAAENV